MYYRNKAFIEITKKSIVAKLRAKGIKTKYHDAIATNVREQLSAHHLDVAIQFAIDKLFQFNEEVHI